MTRKQAARVPPKSQGAADPRRRVRITLSSDLSSLSADRRSAAVDALAAVLGVAPGTIGDQGVRKGRAVFQAAIPSGAVRRLRSLLEANNPQLRLLRVEGVTLEVESGQEEEWTLREGKFGVRVPAEPSAAPHVDPKPQRIRLFRPIVIGVMVGCIAWSFVVLARLFSPAWSGTYLIAGCVLSAVEASYSYRLLRSRRLFGQELLRFRGIELALLFVLLKIAGYVGDSWPAVLADIKRWPHQPLVVLDTETLVAFVLAVLSWLAATATASDLESLGEPPERSRTYVPPAQRLANRFFWGGGVLLVATGLVLIGRTLASPCDRTLIGLVASLRGSSATGLAFNVLLYFILGVVMLGQVRSDALGRRWREQGIPVDRVLPRRWTRASMALVGLAALLAFLLPAGYSVGLLDLVGSVILWAAAVLSYLGAVIVFIGAFLCTPLMALLFRSDATRSEPVPPRFEPPVPPAQAAGPTADWVLLMRSVLFWALIAGGVLYVIRAYLHDHPELSASLARFRPLQALRHLWLAILGLLGRWKQTVQQRLPSRAVRRQVDLRERSQRVRFFRLGALSPRERVLYYYLSILRRAERLGYPRRPPETPYEYDSSLEPHLREAHQEMDALTDAFVEARYSQHAVGSARSRLVRGDWKRVKAALRSLRRTRPAEPTPDSNSTGESKG